MGNQMPIYEVRDKIREAMTLSTEPAVQDLLVDALIAMNESGLLGPAFQMNGVTPPSIDGWPDGLVKDDSGRYHFHGHDLARGNTDAQAIRWAKQIVDREVALDPSNPHGQLATQDRPGEGFKVMTDAEINAILAPYPLLFATQYDKPTWRRVSVALNADMVRQAAQNRGMLRSTWNQNLLAAR